MQPIESEIHFNETEQQLGLPASIPRGLALGVAHDLISSAEVVQAEASMTESAYSLINWEGLGYESFESMLAIRGWDVLSKDAFHRYAVGQQLAELAASEIANDFETYLRSQDSY